MRKFVLESSRGVFKTDAHPSIIGSLMTLIQKIPNEQITLKIRDVFKGEETPFVGTPGDILHFFERAVNVAFGGAIMRPNTTPEAITAMVYALGK
jgi:hypothetical protein